MNIWYAANRGIYIANYIAFACVVLAPLVLMQWSSWRWLVAGLVVWQFQSVFGISVGVHRFFTHKAFKTSRFMQWAMAVVSLWSLNGPPCVWAGTHNLHHAHSDKPNDPYNRFTLDGETPLRHTAHLKYSIVSKFMREDNIHFITIKYHWLIVLCYPIAIVAMASVLGANILESLFWLFLFPAGLTQLTLRFLLWTSHSKSLGYRNFNLDDTSCNWWFLSLISGGEGWHNNHHKYPRRWSFKVEWWEFDIGALLVRLIKTE